MFEGFDHLSLEGKILCIIIGDGHQFIGYCLKYSFRTLVATKENSIEDPFPGNKSDFDKVKEVKYKETTIFKNPPNFIWLSFITST